MSNTEAVAYSVGEMATRYNVNRKTIYRLIAAGELSVLRVGHAIRVPAAAVEAWEKNNTTTGSA